MLAELLDSADLVVDAVFGYSFKPPLKTPFEFVLQAISKHNCKTLSVDMPSGWTADDGPSKEVPLIEPMANISLMNPKTGMRHYTGRHFLGGRFVPQGILDKFELGDDGYRGDELFYELDRV